jgi:hypothetical protein
MSTYTLTDSLSYPWQQFWYFSFAVDGSNRQYLKPEASGALIIDLINQTALAKNCINYNTHAAQPPQVGHYFFLDLGELYKVTNVVAAQHNSYRLGLAAQSISSPIVPTEWEL